MAGPRTSAATTASRQSRAACSTPARTHSPPKRFITVSRRSISRARSSRLQTTYDYSRTWYDFPTRYDAFTANATLSKRFSRTLSLIVNYAATYDYDIYFNGLQGLFYPPVAEIAADGTPWPGYDAFTGASSEALSFDLRLRPLPNVGIDLGRGDQFGWGGQRYTEWTFAVLP